MDKLMEKIEPQAERLKLLDEEIGKANDIVEQLKSEREKLSDQIVADLQAEGIERAVALNSGGYIKLDTQIYPKVMNMDAFLEWGAANNVPLPKMQFHPKTLQGWMSEQIENSQPIPDKEVVSTFIKTRAKITKGG